MVWKLLCDIEEDFQYPSLDILDIRTFVYLEELLENFRGWLSGIKQVSEGFCDLNESNQGISDHYFLIWCQ